MPYKVYAALQEDINSGWVWVGGVEFEQRSIIKITNSKNDSVYCEALKIDNNYRKKYEEGHTSKLENTGNTLIANEWYRRKLGINETKQDHALKVTPENHLYGRFMSSIQHPQVVVRLATWLGAISLVLGFVSVALSFK